MRNPRARSIGFVVVDVSTGEVLSPLFLKRAAARSYVRNYYGLSETAQISREEIIARGLRSVGIHQVKLYPGETFDPARRV